MKKRSGRRKHVPHRTCVACRTQRPKRELIRIVRTPEGQVVVDEGGKRSGRGAYLCAQRTCWQAPQSLRRLEQALRATLDTETHNALQTYAERLPQALEESEDVN